VVGEVLREVVDVAEGITDGRKRRVVVPVQKDLCSSTTRDMIAVRRERRTGRATGVGTAAKNPLTQSEEERMQWTNQLQLVGSRWA
jgi:hypothetical protein